MTTPDLGFQFLLREGRQPFRQSRCFIVADPTDSDRRAWTLELDPPADARWVYELDDVKAWMLHGDKDVRKIFFDRTDPMTPFRELERAEVFREYLRKLVERLPKPQRRSRKYALMPSIAEEKVRKRFKDAIEAAIPGVTVVPEPEMVAEYFRLLQRTLELEKGQNNILLVVDVGASTANMTIVVSRKDQIILDVDERGDRRDLRVRALRGDSVENAGRWIDQRLVELLGVPESLCEEDPALVMRAVEGAKKQSSRTGEKAPVALPSGGEPLVLDHETLVALSQELWGELRPLFANLCERLYDNQTSTEDARKKTAARMAERQVTGGGNAHRLIDRVLLAGGTSLLPGFTDAMLEALFPDDHRPEVVHVGDSFPVAAAAGGLSHVLHTYEPPRLRLPEGDADAGFDATFEGTLPFPLVLGVKRRPSEREKQIVVLDPDDPLVDDGGKRPIEGVPVLTKGTSPRMRLVPGGGAGVDARRGRDFRSYQVRESPGSMEFEWDSASQRGRVCSSQVEGTASGLWIDANKLRRKDEASEQPFVGQVPDGALAVDAADDVVLDFGMSKIVALTATSGWVSAEELQRIVRDGLEEERVEEAKPDLPLDEVESEGITPPPSSPEDDSDSLEQDRDLPLQPEEAASELTVPEPGEEAEDELAVAAPAVTTSPDEGGTERADPEQDPPHASLPSGGPEDVVDDGLRWDQRVGDQAFAHSLQAVRDAAESADLDLRMDDIVAALLALAARPVVLLAGPPGCGKSTLVRVVAHLLGRTKGETFHEVAVQAHWENDLPLFGEDGALPHLLNGEDRSHLLLFDEFNLTRPEYYLSRLFHALEDGKGAISPALRLAPCRAFGTLNIDDTSRPPSPKVVDRCFLLELAQVPWTVGRPTGLGDLAGLPTLPGLPRIPENGASTDPRIDAVLEALQSSVDEHNLRHDFLPSRRVLADTRALLALHNRLDLEATGLLGRDDVVDRVLSSRILVKLSGAFEQLQPALDAVEKAVEGMEELGRTHRRLRLARQQARLGFVSPWQ